MYKKLLGMFLIGTSFFFCSCVDDTYDLANKEISKDIEIKGNKLALPLGSLRPIVLDSLFGGVELIDTTEDGVYCIKQSDTLCIEKEVHPILLAITSKNITKTIPIPSGTPSYAPGTTHTQMKAIDQKSIPFEVSKSVPFEHKEIFRQFKRMYSFSLKEKMQIEFNIKLNGLEALKESSVNLDFTLDFAPFFELLPSNDPNVIVDEASKHRVQIKKEYLTQSDQGIIIDLYCSKLNFKNELADGLTLELLENGYQSHITANGQIVIDCNSADLASLQNIKDIEMDINCSFSPVHVKRANGVFSDSFPKEELSFVFDLGERLASLKEDNNYITLTEPQIEIELHNAICMQTSVELNVVGKNADGEIIPQTVINTEFHMPPAIYDDATGNILVDTSKVLFTSNRDLFKDDYENIEEENLQHWLETVPDTMSFAVHPKIDYRYSPHIIDLYQPFDFSTPYSILIPLKFSKFHFCYSDTIAVNMDVTMDALNNAELKLKMKTANTIPLGLLLKITALDKDDNSTTDITIAPIKLEPGNGESINLQDLANTQEVSLAIKSENGDFSKLSKLKLDIEATSEENKTATLKTTQGIRISDIVIEVSGDFSTSNNQ